MLDLPRILGHRHQTKSPLHLLTLVSRVLDTQIQSQTPHPRRTDTRLGMSNPSMLSGNRAPPTPPRSRQRPGAACDECRRRKLRCDREQPKCGVCAESGVVCQTTAVGPPRGPKRGHLKVLQTRIGECPIVPAILFCH